MNVKQVSVSSYSDLQKLSPHAKSVHFRKFVSKKLLECVLSKCPNVKKISFSKTVFDKNLVLLNSFKLVEVQFTVSNRERGRPNIIEKMISYD